MSKNVFLSALGLPGCGKTTIMREVSKILGTNYYFSEPEEKYWGEAVKEREKVGYFSGLMWFRVNRVPNLIKAKDLYNQGLNVIIDSYYDKSIKNYIGKKGMEWLIDRDDPYFEIAKDVAKIDWQELPNVTHLVTLNVSKEVWYRNLNVRNRELDSNSNLLNSYSTQEYFVSAAEELSREFGIEHIRIDVDEKTIEEVAHEIVNKISVKENIVS